jgi:hypothetical protein
MSRLLHGREAEFPKQVAILIGRGIRRSQKFFAVKDGIGSSQEAEQDSFTAQLGASCGKTDHGSGHQNARRSYGPHHDERVEIRFLS